MLNTDYMIHAAAAFGALGCSELDAGEGLLGRGTLCKDER